MAIASVAPANRLLSALRAVRTSRFDLPLPLLCGPLRGCWWDVSAGKAIRLLLGSYEPAQTKAFRQLVRPGQQVLDIGAATGYYTLLAARCVGTQGSVIAIEPDSHNLRRLRSHVRRNRLDRVQILPLAVGDKHGTAAFGGGRGTGTGRLCDNGASRVQVRPLDSLAEEYRLSPQHVKIDVEGAEEAVLRGGERLFNSTRPTIFLSTHDCLHPGIHQACLHLLSRWGYRFETIGRSRLETASEVLCLPA